MSPKIEVVKKNKYEEALLDAWNDLKEWHSSDKIRPTCEEDIQCFLYHRLVGKLGDARYVKPKPGRFENQKHHFPDFILGGKGEEVVVEIKFSYYTRASSGSKQAGIGACLNDVEKMLKNYSDFKRYFFLFESSDDAMRESNLNEAYLNELKKADPECQIFYFPPTLTEKLNQGQKAWRTRRYGHAE